jgi:hypothetical protein
VAGRAKRRDREWQDEQKKKDHQWQQSVRDSDREWQLKQKTKDRVWAVVLLVVGALFTLAGALVQKHFFGK